MSQHPFFDEKSAYRTIREGFPPELKLHGFLSWHNRNRKSIPFGNNADHTEMLSTNWAERQAAFVREPWKNNLVLYSDGTVVDAVTMAPEMTETFEVTVVNLPAVPSRAVLLLLSKEGIARIAEAIGAPPDEAPHKIIGRSIQADTVRQSPVLSAILAAIPHLDGIVCALPGIVPYIRFSGKITDLSRDMRIDDQTMLVTILDTESDSD